MNGRAGPTRRPGPRWPAQPETPGRSPDRPRCRRRGGRRPGGHRAARSRPTAPDAVVGRRGSTREQRVGDQTSPRSASWCRRRTRRRRSDRPTARAASSTARPTRAAAPAGRQRRPAPPGAPAAAAMSAPWASAAFRPPWRGSGRTTDVDPGASQPSLERGLITDHQDLGTAARQRRQGVQRHGPGQPTAQRAATSSRDFAYGCAFSATTAAAVGTCGASMICQMLSRSRRVKPLVRDRPGRRRTRTSLRGSMAGSTDDGQQTVLLGLRQANPEPASRTLVTVGHLLHAILRPLTKRDWRNQDKVPSTGGVVFVVEPHLQRRSAGGRPVPGVLRSLAALPGQGLALQRPGPRPPAARLRSDPGRAEVGEVGGRAAGRGGGRRGGPGCGDLPRGHHHPGPEPVADEGPRPVRRGSPCGPAAR